MSYQKIIKDTFTRYRNENGKTVSTVKNHIKEADGLAFRDLSGEKGLLPYEDWRLSDEARARDLADRLSVSEMIGLTMYTAGQPLPSLPGKMADVGTYGGKKYGEDASIKASDLTDQQKQMLADGIRHFDVADIESTQTAVEWSNHLQAVCEMAQHGIPCNNASDPRNGAGKGFSVEFNRSDGGVSLWPEGLAMAAAHDPSLANQYAKIISKEYRALGISTALGPQIDLASDPRWFRDSGTLGADIELNIKLTQAICDGYQTTEGSETGWGRDSIVAMAKHWPGGGTGEGGRDAHYPFGKYAVYPGNNFKTHMRSFTEGAFQLPGKTKSCAAIMPYYTVSWNQDTKDGQNVGNSFSRYIIKDLLIEQYGFEGVICTDWDIISDKRPHVGMYVMGGKCYGVEEMTKAERTLRLMTNGVNMFGGLQDKKVVEDAYALGCETYSQEQMGAILHLTAYKTLLNMFRLGLFDDPYLDVAESEQIVGKAESIKAGYEAQYQSLVLLKNRNRVLPLQKGCKVYVPQMHNEAHYNFVRMKSPAEDFDPLAGIDVSDYFERVKEVAEADAAIVFLRTPFNRNGYEFDMMKMRTREPQPEAGYFPISLQYRPYTAAQAREVSIAGGDPNEQSKNRSYRGRTEVSANEAELDILLETRTKMGEKPVIVVFIMDRPLMPAEAEPAANAIIGDFGNSKAAILDVIFGVAPAGGKLPIILPVSMETVEQHCEDLPDDMEAYVDSEGNAYTIGFGL